MGPSLPLSRTGDILQRAEGLTHGTAAFLPWQIWGLFVTSQKGWKQLSLLSNPMGQVSSGAGYIPGE